MTADISIISTSLELNYITKTILKMVSTSDPHHAS